MVTDDVMLCAALTTEAGVPVTGTLTYYSDSLSLFLSPFTTLCQAQIYPQLTSISIFRRPVKLLLGMQDDNENM